MIVPGIVVGALLPAFSALHGRARPTSSRSLYHTALRYVALVGAPLAALVAALAPALIVWLYGDAYLPAAPWSASWPWCRCSRRCAGWRGRRCAPSATAAARSPRSGRRRRGQRRPGRAADSALDHRGAVIATAAGQLTATVWVFVGIARIHRVAFPLADLAKIAAAGTLTLVVTWASPATPTISCRLGIAAVGRSSSCSWSRPSRSA